MAVVLESTRRTSAERVAAHYNIAVDEAERWLKIHPESELLPERGTGLTRDTAVGISNPSSQTASLLIGGLLGAVVGGVLGAIVISVLKSS